MVGNSKVLTVAYGTFSCTLEGFDDSFDTMKAIAEYFRDLAADDRYFGAEPPQPDAQLLAKIAAKELDRKVAGRIEGSNVVLRPADAKAAGAAGAVIATEPQVDVAVPEVAADPKDDVSEDTKSDTTEDVIATEKIAEAFDRADNDIETVLSEELPAGEVDEVDAEDDQDAAEDIIELDDDVAEDDVASGEDIQIIDETDEAAPDEDVNLPAEADLDGIEDVSFDDDLDAADTGSEDDDIETVTEKLAKIRDVVDEDTAQDRYNEDQHAEDVTASEDAPKLDDDFEQDEAAPAARVIKMKKADFAKAIAEGQFKSKGTVQDLDGLSDIASAVAETDGDLTSEEEEDLMAELAQVEAEHPAPEPGRKTLDNHAGGADEAADRLMGEADAKLADPDNKASREGFQQLKAAVAATEAARQLGEKMPGDDADADYRADLDKTVKKPATSKAAAAKAAPLTLVAAQRVDQEDEATAEPAYVTGRKAAAKARRAGRTLARSGQNTGSFQDFATSVGAVDLPDLLEAAAAYTAFVEGETKFSRPALMKKVSGAMDGEFSREEGLRVFGRLLRKGTIRKIKAGTFEVDENTRFNPEARAAS